MANWHGQLSNFPTNVVFPIPLHDKTKGLFAPVVVQVEFVLTREERFLLWSHKLPKNNCGNGGSHESPLLMNCFINCLCNLWQ